MRSISVKLFYGLLYLAPVALLTLVACGGGGGGGAAIIKSLLGGSTTGLTSNGLVLQNNGSDDLVISGVVSGVAGFAFSQKVAEGVAYSITVLAQPDTPSRQECGVTGASGVMPASNLSSVLVGCVNVFGVGMEIHNLATEGLTLQNHYILNSQDYYDMLAVSAIGFGQVNLIPIEFGTLLPASTVYDVLVAAQPTAHSCSFQSASSVSPTSISGVITTDVTLVLNCI